MGVGGGGDNDGVLDWSWNVEKIVVALAYGGGEWNVTVMMKKKRNFYEAPPRLRYLQKSLVVLFYIYLVKITSGLVLCHLLTDKLEGMTILGHFHILKGEN